jgi:hypothetical protein
MNATVRLGAVVALVVLSIACGSSRPASPIEPSRPDAVPVPTGFPPLSGPARIFVFDRELSYPVAAYTKTSRFVLYDNGAFALQYEGLGEYRGRYTESNGEIGFDWEGGSAAGPWGATGTLKGDSLTVQYNVIMQLTDFDDAVYVLMKS